MASKCKENAEKRCDSYPRCYGCNAYVSYDKYYKAKENKSVMNISDVSLNFGGKNYAVTSYNLIQTPHDYPEIEATVTLNPRNIIANHTSNPTITNVIFNPPATIVFWSDRTKTVVKCDYDHEAFDPEKGLAMAIAKKMIGNNKRTYYHTFLHWMKKWEKQWENTCDLEEIEAIIKPIREHEFTLSCAPGSVFLDGKQFNGFGHFTFDLGKEDDEDEDCGLLD